MLKFLTFDGLCSTVNVNVLADGDKQLCLVNGWT